MRTIEYGTATHVPAFLTKLWKLVTDESCDELICWSGSGNSFIIFDEIRFSKELLPMYFKHNNMASFIRQLNMYGFRKLSCIDQGGMHCYRNEIEFYHQYFIKGQETLLELIKRKIPNSKSEDPRVKQECIDELVSHIKSLKGKQDNTDQYVRTLRRENRILWRQVNMLADGFSKQQAVIQQLVPFFMNMVRSNQESLKRKPPLMIGESDIQAKVARMSPYYSDQDRSNSLPSPPGNVSNRGPVIHDVTEMESHKMFPANILCSSNITTSKECEAIVDSPLSCSIEGSEQTMDSSYNEPGSMETLNILNHDFQRFENWLINERRRTNSASSMELNNSCNASSSSASPTLQLSSPKITMPSRSPMGNYNSVQSISPVAIIDETTSDVPLENLMQNFVPKMETTNNGNGIYAISSILREDTSSMMNEKQSFIKEHPLRVSHSTIMNRDPTSIVNGNVSLEDASQIINSGRLNNSQVINENSFIDRLHNMKQSMLDRQEMVPEQLSLDRPSTFNPQPSNLVERSQILSERIPLNVVRSPVLDKNPTLMMERALMNEESSSLLENQPIMMSKKKSMINRIPLISESSSTMNSSSLVNEESRLSIDQSSIPNEGPSSLLDRTSRVSPRVLPIAVSRDSMANGETSNMMNTSCRDQKFVQNEFPDEKNSMTDMNWIFNQESYANDANIENWLGQIFKADSLAASCLSQDKNQSLKQQQ